MRFLRYAACGLLVLALQVGGVALFSLWLGKTPAYILAYGLAVTMHYLVNRFWALRSSRPDVSRQAGEYLVTALGGFLTSLLLFQLATDFMRLPPLWAVLLVNPVTTIGVFLVLNFRVFRS